jgi:hypothetical protein
MKYIFLFLCVAFLFSCASENSKLNKTQNQTENTISEQIDDNKFYGILTIDTFDVAKCSIIEIGDMIQAVSYFKRAQREDFRNPDNFLQAIGDYVYDKHPAELKEEAIQKGYNVVLGYKTIPVTHYDGFGSSIVNGMNGVGYGVLIAQGTPAKVVCK